MAVAGDMAVGGRSVTAVAGRGAEVREARAAVDWAVERQAVVDSTVLVKADRQAVAAVAIIYI